MRNKKGFTLIEVVVALGILTIVLSATVTLIIQVVNLAMITRDKTEATALVQKGLSEKISDIKKCGGTLTDSSSVVNGKNLYVYIDKEKDASGNYTVVDNDVNILGTRGSSITSANFYKIIAVVKWNFRGIEYTSEATQYVGKNI
jgi:prepilin-type N-terminal cleavage/methylation domain-containing protein